MAPKPNPSAIALARKKLAAAVKKMNAAAIEAQSIMDRTGRMRDVPPEVAQRHASALAEVKRYEAELGIKWDDDASEKRAKAGLVVASVELSRALGVKPGESLSPAELNAKIAEHTRSVQAVRDAGEPRNKIIAASLVSLLAGHGFKRDPWPDITARMLRWPLGQGARTNGSQTVQWFGPHSDKGLDIDENLQLELIDSHDGTLIRKIRIVPGRGREANAIAKLLGKSADTSNSPESHAGYASE